MFFATVLDSRPTWMVDCAIRNAPPWSNRDKPSRPPLGLPSKMPRPNENISIGSIEIVAPIPGFGNVGMGTVGANPMEEWTNHLPLSRNANSEFASCRPSFARITSAANRRSHHNSLNCLNPSASMLLYSRQCDHRCQGQSIHRFDYGWDKCWRSLVVDFYPVSPLSFFDRDTIDHVVNQYRHEEHRRWWHWEGNEPQL